MTVTVEEIRQLAFIDADQVWPLTEFTNKPPATAVIQTNTGDAVKLTNWHVGDNCRADDDQSAIDRRKRLAVVGQVLGGSLRFGFLQPGPQTDQAKLDQLNAITDTDWLYVAFRMHDRNGRPSRSFAVAGLGGFMLRASRTDPGLQRAQPIVRGRNDQLSRLPYDVHNGWLFY